MKTNINDLAKKISELNFEELDDVVTTLLIQYGMSATIYHSPIGVMRTMGSHYVENVNVHLDSVGKNKITVIKLVKETFNLGLKDALGIINKTPCVLAENLAFNSGMKIKRDFENIGATINLR